MHKENGLTTKSADTDFPGSQKKVKVSSRAQAEVIECRDVTADLKVIKVKPEVSFTFQPGQCVKLEIGGVKRRYSLVSAPHERFLEFFIERVPSGSLSPQLWRLGCGDLVTLRPRAKGKFLLDPRFSNHLMLATVTGIGPFVSILRSYLYHQPAGHRFYVLHGASYQDEFAYRAEIEDMAAAYPDLVTYVPTISRPGDVRNALWTSTTGRVNTIVERYVEQFGLNANSTLLYACGHPQMIADIQARFTPKGFQVREERYWKV
jgi:ferredoxin-NADP reductase